MDKNTQRILVRRAVEALGPRLYDAVAPAVGLPPRRRGRGPRERRLTLQAATWAEDHSPEEIAVAVGGRELTGKAWDAAVRRVRHYIEDGRGDQAEIARLLRGGRNRERWEHEQDRAPESRLHRLNWYLARAVLLWLEREPRTVVKSVGEFSGKRGVRRGTRGKGPRAASR